ncbi:MAG: hypothetical protein WKG01_11305 [Kofleriaceae bacterium]
MEHAYDPNAGSGGGWLARIVAIFGGGGTPVYAGGGQPSPGMLGGLFGGGSSPYGSARSQAPAELPRCSSEASMPLTCIDPEAMAAGQIAIVIPRSGP